MILELREKISKSNRLSKRNSILNYSGFTYMWRANKRIECAEKFKVSVIMPAYNVEKHIERAIKSALRQGEVGEIIVIEDYSTDGTLKLVNSLVNRYSKIKLIRHKSGRNRGAGKSRNLGIVNAQYDFVSFLDADDYYLSERFASNREMFLEDESLDGIYGIQKLEFECNTLEKNRAKSGLPMVDAIGKRLSSDQLFTNMNPIGNSGYFHGNTLTVRKNVFDKVGYFSSLECCQDVQMWLKMAYVLNLKFDVRNNPSSVKGVHIANRMSRDKTRQYRTKVFLSVLKFTSKQKFNKRDINKLLVRYFDALVNIDYIDISNEEKLCLLEKHLFEVIQLLGYRSYFLKESLQKINKKRIGLSQSLIFCKIIITSFVSIVLKTVSLFLDYINFRSTRSITK